MESIGSSRSRAVEARAAASGKWWTLASVCTGMFMLLLDITTVNVALPDIERSFTASARSAVRRRWEPAPARASEPRRGGAHAPRPAATSACLSAR
jgi:hypothetical protein